MRPVITAAVVAAGLALTAAACSSSPPKPPAIAGLVNKLGCTGYQTGNEAFTRENGSCDIAGASVDLATFSTADQRDHWVKAAQSFSGIIITGDLWAADADSQQAADAVKTKLGGTEH
jgi:hypothetical protein